MDNLIPFPYGDKTLRALTVDGEPWFVAKDACDILELDNASQAVSRLDDDERNTIILNEGIGNPEKSIVSEPGLYSLILGSKKPEAKPFKRWVTHEVIPSIRKTGTYSTRPRTQAELIAAEAQQIVELERKANAALETAQLASSKVDSALDALAKPPEPDWQASVGTRIKAMAQKYSLSYVVLFGDLYKELEDSARCNLQSRVNRLQGRMKKSGATYKERADISKLHVIGLDPALKLAFDGIVRRYEAKYSLDSVPVS